MDWIIMVAVTIIAGILAYIIGTNRWRNKYQTELLLRTKLETQLVAQGESHQEKIAALTALKNEFQEKLETIATTALRNNQATFLQLANENFTTHKQKADTDLETRKKEVEALVTPINETLKAFKTQVDELEKTRASVHGALTAELKNVIETQQAVRAETSKLVNALRAAPKTRGRWGEQALYRVLELAGLSQHCDFSKEKTYEREGSLFRPDVTINMPGDRKLFVDAKTPITAYLDAVDATDEATRDTYLTLHAKHMRDHVKQLSSKEYWDSLSSIPDYVVMFIPGDNFYTAAIERDPSLFEEAVAKRVIIVTPATLIALAKAVAFGWRQEKVAENTKKVHDAGRELYRRLITMSDHIRKCGNAITASVTHYNSFIGSLELKVLPQARKFNELEVEGTDNEIPQLENIDSETRQLQASDFNDEGSRIAIKAL